MRTVYVLLFSLALLLHPASAAADFAPPPPPPPGPVINASDITVYTHTADAVSVTYTVTAIDPILAESPAVVCEPASGSSFPVGDTNVSCSATNSAGTTKHKDFNVSVILDDTPPTITVPSDQEFTVTSVPAVPDLIMATAIDDYDSAPVVTFSPASFPEGTTEITWTATDAAGNSSTATSNVTIALESSSEVPDPVAVNLRIFTSSATLYDGPIIVSACPDTEGGATYTVNAVCAVAQAAESAGFEVVWNWSAYGAALVRAGGEGDWSNGPWFTTFSDLVPLYVALNAHTLTPGESLLITSGPMPLKISVSDAHPVVGETTTISVSGFDPIAFSYAPVAGATIDGTGLTTDAAGSVGLIATSTDTLVISASRAGSITSATTSISATAAEAPSGGGGGGTAHTPFNVRNALAFVSSKQSANGSFGADFVTDWVALAFAASDPGIAKTKLRDHLKATTPAMGSVLDYERHAMALMAIGVSPYDGTSVDYISPIVAAFDGAQIGSPSLENDDIFGIMPLLKAGYSANDDIIRKPVAFIISRQAADGSWTGGVDMTAAAVQALTPVQALPGVNDALAKAKGYLHSHQAGNGGFGNTPATAWAAQAVGALGESDAAWAPGGYYADDYLGSEQRSDGGVDAVTATEQNRIWNTAYAITGSLKRPWPSLLAAFTKPVAPAGGGGAAVSPSASTTAPVATSTALVSTSTPLVQAASSTAASATTSEATASAEERIVHEAVRIARSAPPSTRRPAMATTTLPAATSTPATVSNLALAATPETPVPWWAILLAILALLIVSYIFRRKRATPRRS